MSSVRDEFTKLFSEAFTSLGLEARFGQVTVSDRPDLGHYQCNGALPAAKSLKKNPREVAQSIIHAVQEAPTKRFGDQALQLSIAGPGFINIVISDALLSRFVGEQTSDDRLGVPKVESPRVVTIDYGGTNVAKGMHVGHLRSSIIGDSLARLYRFLGDKVIGDNHLGDWGTQMGMLICELKERQPQLPYFDENFKGTYPSEPPVTLKDLEEMYPHASARYKAEEDFKRDVLKATDELQQGRVGYKRLWEQFVKVTLTDQERDYERLGIHFDLWLGESFYEDRMPALVENFKKSGHTEVSEGALIIPLADEKDPEMPPVILVKSGGGFLYHTSDLATIQYRVEELKAQLSLYVVDKRQSLHFKQVFKAAQKAGILKDMEVRHLGFGTMNGTDGKPFKTRSGGILKLKELIQLINDEAQKRLSELQSDRPYDANEMSRIAEKVGIATLKYADLRHNRSVDYVFDLEKFSRFEGNTGPYLLYATVRIKSIFRKAVDQGLQPGQILAPTVASERKLLLELLKLPDVLRTAYNEGEPHHICEYGFNLSQTFNAFYAECHILRETDKAKQSSWLALCKLTHDHLELALDLLGIQVPDRM